MGKISYTPSIIIIFTFWRVFYLSENLLLLFFLHLILSAVPAKQFYVFSA